jgi:agmatinase
MSEGFVELGSRRPPAESLASSSIYQQKAKLVTLGGDHSIALAALRAVSKAYEQPIAVVCVKCAIL